MKQLTMEGFKEAVADGVDSTILIGTKDYSLGLTPGAYAQAYIEPETTITLIPGTGATARIEYTLSTIAEVEAGTAVWQAWAKGDITATATDALLGRVTALRMITAGGDSIWEVR